MSRKVGTLAIGRFAFGATLLAVMWILWSAEFAQSAIVNGSSNEIGKILNRFAEEFSLTFFLIQLTLVLLLTPIFVCGSVFEERDTRSGEVLLTTDLTRREIFYGKLIARMVQVGMVVAAGMPILSLTLLWGGVAIHFIIVGYVATFLCIVSSGAVAASVSSSSQTFREAVLKAYAWIVVFNGLVFPASPYLLIVISQEEPGASIWLGIFFLPIQLVVIFVSLAHGLRWLRLAMLRQRRRVTAELAEKMAKRNPPIPNEDPLVWKERYVAGGNEMTDVLVGSHCITLVFVVGSFVLFMPGRLPAGWVSVYVTPFLLVGTAALFGLGTAASVARERQKNTLVDLFMIPGGRREILRAKLLGAIWFGRWPALTLLTLILLSVAGGTPIAAIPFLLLCSAAFLAFGTFLGLWLSVVCRSTLTANAIWVGVIAFSLVGTFLLAETMSSREIDSTGQLRIVYPRWSQVVNPILGWQELAMTPEVGPKDYAIGTSSWIRVVPLKWPDITDSLVGTALYGGLGWLLWLLSLRRFEKEGREE